MADKKKKKKNANAPKKDEKVTKSALARNMESQKKSRVAAVKSKPKNTSNQQQQQQENRGGLKEYFSGVKTEVKKVVWPTRKELVSYTIVVGIACAFFGLFLWGVDSGFLVIIREVFSINMN